MLSGVDPELEQQTLNTQLQFNPDYYRFWNETELNKTEEQLQQEKKNSLEKDEDSIDGKRRPIVPFERRNSQKVILFPFTEPVQVKENLLAPIDEDGSFSSVENEPQLEVKAEQDQPLSDSYPQEVVQQAEESHSHTALEQELKSDPAKENYYQ